MANKINFVPRNPKLLPKYLFEKFRNETVAVQSSKWDCSGIGIGRGRTASASLTNPDGPHLWLVRREIDSEDCLGVQLVVREDKPDLDFSKVGKVIFVFSVMLMRLPAPFGKPVKMKDWRFSLSASLSTNNASDVSLEQFDVTQLKYPIVRTIAIDALSISPIEPREMSLREVNYEWRGLRGQALAASLKK